MWHVHVGGKQADGNSVTQWFTFRVQGSRRGGKKKEKGNLIAKMQKTPWNQMVHCIGCSSSVQGSSWNK